MTPWRTSDITERLWQRRALQCGHGSDAVENAATTIRAAIAKACFNAATAVTPWRTANRDKRIALSCGLQCGHGSDAVENAELRMYFMVSPWLLQCGHGSDAVENGHVKAVRSKLLKASMRPRQ